MGKTVIEQELLWARRIDEPEIARLCTSLVRNVGRDAAVTAHKLFKTLDKGQVARVADLEPRELRKKVRHLCEAYGLSAVDMESVPGVKPIILSFRKPRDCPLNLARSLKQFLTAAVSRDAREEADIEGEAEDLERQRQEVTAQEAQDHEARMEMIRETLTQGQEKAAEEQKAEAVPQVAPSDFEGALTLEDYKELKEKAGGKVAAMQYTRDFDESDVPQKSLMELKREGVFGDTKGAVERFHRAVQQQDMWGKSSGAQRKRQMEINMKATKRARLGEDVNSDEEEPWTRFDREKIFQPRQASEREFESIMQMATEHKAGFTSGRIE